MLASEDYQKLGESLTVSEKRILRKLFFSRYTINKHFFKKDINSAILDDICKEVGIYKENNYPLIKELIRLRILILDHNGEKNSKFYYINKNNLY
ncbi:MAG: hypothetical protein AABY22_21585, partial [Nanoarchaeota archaeon]